MTRGVADGYQAHQFFRTMSRIYTGVESDHPLSPRHFFLPEPPQEAHTLDESDAGPSFWSSRHFTLPEAFALYRKDFEIASSVSVRVSPERVDKLLALAKSLQDSPISPIKDVSPPTESRASSTAISRQDALSAYVASLLAIHGEQIYYIRNNFDVRVAFHSASHTLMLIAGFFPYATPRLRSRSRRPFRSSVELLPPPPVHKDSFGTVPFRSP